jgi:hypothetical protein
MWGCVHGGLVSGNTPLPILSLEAEIEPDIPVDVYTPELVGLLSVERPVSLKGHLANA